MGRRQDFANKIWPLINKLILCENVILGGKNQYYSRLKVCFLFKRKIGFYLMQLYIPSGVIVILAWLGSISNHASFGDLISVLLSMLFLYYSYLSVMPKVSEFKAIDIFLSVSFAFICSALLSYFWTEQQLPREADTKSVSDMKSRKWKPCSASNSPSDKTDQASTPTVHENMEKLFYLFKKYKSLLFRCLYPISFFMFCASYFTFYLHTLSQNFDVNDCTDVSTFKKTSK